MLYYIIKNDENEEFSDEDNEIKQEDIEKFKELTKI